MFYMSTLALHSAGREAALPDPPPNLNPPSVLSPAPKAEVRPNERIGWIADANEE
jgi:hypothetical protein